MPITPEGIKGWTDLFYSNAQNNANRPFLQDLAQANRDLGVAEAGIKMAENQFAPQYYGSRADEMTNNAGLAGVNLKYQPLLHQQTLANGGLANAINQLNLKKMQNEMNNPTPTLNSPFGKLVQDRETIKGVFGEGSPQLQIFDKHIQNEAAGKKGAGMTVFDPATGNMIMTTGNVSENGVIPTGPTTNKLQANISDLMSTRNDLKNIGNIYADEYLTFTGKGRALGGANWDKLTGSLPLSEKQFLERKTQFDNMANQVFDKYRQTITGAAASEKELEKLKKSILNTDQSPTQFKASLQLLDKKLEEAIINDQKILNQGFPQVQPAQPSGAHSPLPGTPVGIRRYNPATGRIE